MPDSEFLSLSATEIPALLGLSNWQTPLMLFHEFRSRQRKEKKQSLRMKLGKIFEPLILEEVAQRLNLQVRHNVEQVYVRNDALKIGATIDFDVQCPSRGFGIVEVKAIDKDEFAKNWSDTAGPRMYETQLQTGMQATGATWGVLAPFVYNDGEDGELTLYERRPHKKAQERIAAAASAFFDDLAHNRPPPAFGNPIEMELMAELYPEVDPAKVLEATDNVEMAEQARLYAWTVDQARGFERAVKEMQPKLLDFAKDYGLAKLAAGVRLRVRKSAVAGQIIMLPYPLRKALREAAEYITAQENLSGRPTTHAATVIQAADFCHIARQPGIQSRIAVFDDDADDQRAAVKDNLMNIEA